VRDGDLACSDKEFPAVDAMVERANSALARRQYRVFRWHVSGSIIAIYLGYHPTEDITASLGIDNLFNKQYAPYLNTYAGGTTGSTILPFPSPGITVKGEVKVRLGVPAAPTKVAQAR
jgi:hypothetical protein